jgi:hypothetical protein
MYALSISCAGDEALQRALLDEAFGCVVHVDRATQVEPALLEERLTPSPQLFERHSVHSVGPDTPPLGSSMNDDQEVSAAVGSLRPGPTAERSGGSSSAARPSGGVSPFWPLDEDEDRDGMWAGGDDDSDGLPEAEAEEQVRELELCPPCEPQQVEHDSTPFLSGHPSMELEAGAISFFRFSEPSGVHGLRPPPFRSNLICLMAVPSYLISSDLIRFIGGYARYIRHMRLVRDASRPHRRCACLP